MFDEPQVVNRLKDRVDELLVKFEELRIENEELRNELVNQKAQNEVKDTQIAKLQDSLRFKEVESEDIFDKIEAVLGR
ncbi:MAG: hypothetical protein GX170_09275 [Campylobacteraceae bacterium]|nr:hypothetical protein [Campylobacteraceae bacterium]